MGQIDDDPDALQREIERASRLASVVGDPTTYQRLKQFVEELKQNLQRRLAARRSKEAIRKRARELWEASGCPPDRDLDSTRCFRVSITWSSGTAPSPRKDGV
jgi:hypothetical protein